MAGIGFSPGRQLVGVPALVGDRLVGVQTASRCSGRSTSEPFATRSATVCLLTGMHRYNEILRPRFGNHFHDGQEVSLVVAFSLPTDDAPWTFTIFVQIKPIQIEPVAVDAPHSGFDEAKNNLLSLSQKRQGLAAVPQYSKRRRSSARYACTLWPH